MMDWIKVYTNLRDNPHVVRLSTALHPPESREYAYRTTVLGGLQLVWGLFDQYTTDGFLKGYSYKNLDDFVQIPGFAQAMAAIGWLEIVPEGIQLSRFMEHNSHSAKGRAQTQIRVERHRVAKGIKDNSSNKAERSCNGNVTLERYTSVTREEKKEENTGGGVQVHYLEKEKTPPPPGDGGAGGRTVEAIAAAEKLRGLGIGPKKAEQFADTLKLICIDASLDEYEQRRPATIKNPAGWLVRVLESHRDCDGKHVTPESAAKAAHAERLKAESKERRRVFQAILAGQEVQAPPRATSLADLLAKDDSEKPEHKST